MPRRRRCRLAHDAWSSQPFSCRATRQMLTLDELSLFWYATLLPQSRIFFRLAIRSRCALSRYYSYYAYILIISLIYYYILPVPLLFRVIARYTGHYFIGRRVHARSATPRYIWRLFPPQARLMPLISRLDAFDARASPLMPAAAHASHYFL